MRDKLPKKKDPILYIIYKSTWVTLSKNGIQTIIDRLAEGKYCYIDYNYKMRMMDNGEHCDDPTRSGHSGDQNTTSRKKVNA